MVQLIRKSGKLNNIKFLAVQVRFFKAEILEKILSAQYNLVDLHVVEDEVLRSPANSYAGVYGSFCELDFSQHKEDPSSGTYGNICFFFGSFLCHFYQLLDFLPAFSHPTSIIF